MTPPELAPRLQSLPPILHMPTRMPAQSYSKGRNLPDKEFRYLRTVIVTAAVYRGFNSVLAHLLLTFRHRAVATPWSVPPMNSCLNTGPPYPEVTESTCVGLGYGLYAGAISWNPWAARAFANELGPLFGSVTTSRPTNIDVVPIVYGCRPRLRGRLTLRGLTLRRNPWTYGESVSHAFCRYLCQHPHFRYLQEPSRVSLRRLTERSATTLSSPQLRCMA
eukprot:gene36877-48102_t